MKQSRSKTMVIDHKLLHRALLLSLMTLAACMLLASPAHATLCAVSAMARGFIPGLSTLGVLTVGAGATLGRVSWTTAVTVAVGCAILSNAVGIAASLAGGAC